MARRTSEEQANIGSGDGAPGIQSSGNNTKKAYADVCDVMCTRAEVVLSFGVNKTRERGAPGVEVELTSRLILSPFGAKRLARLLKKFVEEYEEKAVRRG